MHIYIMYQHLYFAGYYSYWENVANRRPAKKKDSTTGNTNRHSQQN